MSWLFSRVLVAEYSAENSSDGVPYAQLNGMNMPEMFLSHGKTTEHSRLSRFGMMCKPLTDDLGEELLKKYRGGSLAKTLVQQEKEQGSTVSDQVCGVKWRELSAKYCLKQFGWKTHQLLWEEDLQESLVILPRWGMTVNGVLWERIMQAPLTNANEFGFWRTPDCANGGTVSEDSLCDMAGGNMTRASGQAKQLILQDQVRHHALWPTITQHGNYNRKGISKNSGDGLATAVRMRGTPKCQDERAAITDGGKSNLGEEVHGNSDISNGERLNPDWVEWLMGWPIGYTRLSPIVAEVLSWDEDPADSGSIPRVTNEKLHRSERIKRIGNGQCPQALVLAYSILSTDDIPKKHKQISEEAA